MGALPDQQLTLGFLEHIHKLWLDWPGDHPVEKPADDLVPALAQIFIKALAADSRHLGSASQQRKIWIAGGIRRKNGHEDRINLRETLNKVVHGIPIRVLVENEVVYLHFRNTDDKEDWDEAWFSGTQLIRKLEESFGAPSGQIRDAIAQLIQYLGTGRLIPRSAAENKLSAVKNDPIIYFISCYPPDYKILIAPAGSVVPV